MSPDASSKPAVHDIGATNEPERPASFFADAFEWTTEYTKAKKYFRTRRAILDGESLFDVSESELKRRDLMGPLSFNWFESSLAALPTQVLVAIGWFFSKSNPVAVAPGASETFTTVFSKVSGLLTPLVVPFSLFFTAALAARFSLRSRHWSKAALRRARNAFLYYDGAHYLWPSTGIAFLFTLATLTGWDPMVMLSGMGLSAYVAFRRVADDMFEANGYRTGPYAGSVMTPTESAPLGDPPPLRLFEIGVGVGSLIVFVTLSFTASLVAFLVAIVADALRR